MDRKVLMWCFGVAFGLSLITSSLMFPEAVKLFYTNTLQHVDMLSISYLIKLIVVLIVQTVVLWYIFSFILQKIFKS